MPESEQWHPLVVEVLAKIEVKTPVSGSAIPKGVFAIVSDQFKTEPDTTAHLHALAVGAGLLELGLDTAGKQFVTLAKLGLTQMQLANAERQSKTLRKAASALTVTDGKKVQLSSGLSVRSQGGASRQLLAELVDAERDVRAQHDAERQPARREVLAARLVAITNVRAGLQSGEAVEANAKALLKECWQDRD